MIEQRISTLSQAMPCCHVHMKQYNKYSYNENCESKIKIINKVFYFGSIICKLLQHVMYGMVFQNTNFYLEINYSFHS